MKVSVLMPSYNHENTISEAIDSFLTQQCNFDIELLIGNDASTDNTLEIAKKYADKHPEQIKLINHPANLGLLKNYKSLIDVAQGEYFAILESDDYWTDTQKLQKQIDFLDANPKVGMSFTRWERLRDGIITQKGFDGFDLMAKYPDRLYERFLLRNIIKSPTVVFRRSFYEKYCDINEYIRLNFITFDYPVWLSLIRNSGVYFLNEPTAVYRYLGSSISNNASLDKKIEFEDNVSKIRNYIISLYGMGKLTRFQLNLREAIVKSRHAFRSKKPTIAAFLFFKELTKKKQR